MLKHVGWRRAETVRFSVLPISGVGFKPMSFSVEIVGRGMKVLCLRTIDAYELTRWIGGILDCLVNAIGKSCKIRIEGADDGACMIRRAPM